VYASDLAKASRHLLIRLHMAVAADDFSHERPVAKPITNMAIPTTQRQKSCHPLHDSRQDFAAAAGAKIRRNARTTLLFRKFSQASNPIRTSGTTSTAPNAPLLTKRRHYCLCASLHYELIFSPRIVEERHVCRQHFLRKQFTCVTGYYLSSPAGIRVAIVAPLTLFLMVGRLFPQISIMTIPCYVSSTG